MSRRGAYFECVQRDTGWLARVRGANGHKVFQSEIYQRQTAAMNAFRVVGDLFGCAKSRVVEQRSGPFAGYLHVPTREDDQTAAWLAIPIRYSDERTR